MSSPYKLFRITFTPATGSEKGKSITRSFIEKDQYAAHETCLSLFPGAEIHSIRKER